MKITFFERIFFYHFKALMGFASLFPWNRNSNNDVNSGKTLSQKEEFIMYLLFLYWCYIAMIYTFIFSFGILEFVFSPSHRKIAFIVSFILAILSMLPLIRWWDRKKYVQSYAAFKEITSKDENYVVWVLLTTLLVLTTLFFPAFIIAFLPLGF